jgi:arabinoxylan arabinofuranohydrolase
VLFRSVLGHPFIHRGIPGVEDVIWCFDPDVLIDDDGSAFLYFGGGVPSDTIEDSLHPRTTRVIRLGDDMISTRGRAITIDAPAFYESSGINKINGKYYFTYSTNFTGDLTNERPEGYPGFGEIAHMISNSPIGPFEYAGVILKNTLNYFGGGGNSHQCIFNFKNEWFITYHTQTLALALGRTKGYRSPHINKLDFYGNGRIKPIFANREGVVLPGTVDPYKLNPANKFAWCKGIKTNEDEQGSYLTNIHSDDWIAIANVDFGLKGAWRFIVFVSSFVGGEIEIRLDNPFGNNIGSLGVGTTDTDNFWEERSCEVKAVSGVHHLFLVFKGDSENNLFNLKCWNFEPFV